MGSRSDISICVLGPMKVHRDGSAVHLSERLLGLLAMLTMNAGRVVSRTALSDALWPDMDEKRATNNLGYSIAELRKRFGESGSSGDDGWIQTDPPGYRLEATPDTLDVLDFERRLDRARSIGRSTPAALSAYREAFATWDDPAGTAYRNLEHAEFCQIEIHRLRELWVSAIEEQISIELELGGEQDVLPRLSALTSAFPYRERLWKHHMTALYRTGRQTEALRIYGQVREMLAESGIEPGTELQDLEEQILVHAPELETAEPAVGRVATVPRSLRALVGRDVDVGTLNRWINDRPLVTVVGLGGVGKTRLAAEVARVTAPTFEAEPVFVDLAAISEPRSVASALAAACGLRQHPGRPSIELVVEFLRLQRRLMVLDNCEHLLPDVADEVVRLVEDVDGLSVLATSRIPLGIHGELVHTLQPLATSGEGTPPAIELLVDAVDSTRETVDPGQPATVELVELLGGIPLAIELAARHLGTVTIGQILDELRPGVPQKSGLGAADASTSAILEACEWSYRALDDSEQALLRTLGLTTGGAGLELLRRLVGDSIVSAGPLVGLLARLVDMGLVVTRNWKTNKGEVARWTLLEPVRQFALACFTDDPARRAAMLDHARAAAGLAVSEARAMMTDPSRVDAIRAEEANFISAIQRSLDAGVPEIAASLTTALDYYWVFAGRAREGRRWVERTCEAFPDLAASTAELPDAHLRASLMRSRGFLASIDGDYGAGVAPLERSIELFDRLAERLDGRARHAAVRGSAWSRMHLARSLSASYFSRYGFDPSGEDRALVEWAVGMYRRAEADLDGAGFVEDRAFVLPFLGWNAVISGIERPEQWFEEAIGITDNAGLPIPGGIARANLAWFLLLEGAQPSRVQTLLESACETFRGFGDLYSLQISLTVSAIAAQSVGDHEVAEARLSEALTVMALQGSQEWGHLTLGLAATRLATRRSHAFDQVVGWLDVHSPNWRVALASSGVDVDMVEDTSRASNGAEAVSESQIARLAKAALLHPSG